MRIRKTRGQKAYSLNKPFMGDLKGDWKFERRKLSVREGAVHVLLLLVLGLFLYFYFIESDRTAMPMIAQGDGAEIFQNCLGGERQDVLVLALNPMCSWCRASYPFYRTIIEHIELAGAPLSVIASVDTSSSVAVQQIHLEAAGVFPDSVMACPLRTAGVSGVPTVVHIDRHGSVRNVWSGFLGDAQQKELLDSIDQLNAEPSD